MNKLLTGHHLYSEICSMVEDAEEHVLLACPYIILHQHIKIALKKHLRNSKVTITILYGKGDHRLQDDDLQFLKTFLNIKVYYHKNLHAKFYANEKNAIITSLNLNLSSHNYNVEYGIKVDAVDQISQDIQKYFNEVIKESEEVILKEEKLDLSTISEIKVNYPNAYEKWTIDEDEKLEKMYCEGISVKELSSFFKRQESAIRSRIAKLELQEKFG